MSPWSIVSYILSINSTAASSVEWCFLNPYWLSNSKFIINYTELSVYIMMIQIWLFGNDTDLASVFNNYTELSVYIMMIQIWLFGNDTDLASVFNNYTELSVYIMMIQIWLFGNDTDLASVFNNYTELSVYIMMIQIWLFGNDIWLYLVMIQTCQLVYLTVVISYFSYRMLAANLPQCNVKLMTTSCYHLNSLCEMNDHFPYPDHSVCH